MFNVLGKLVCYLDFENQAESGTSIKDKSENSNNGYRERGLLLVNFKGCGNAAYLYCGDILFHGDTFQAKPYSGNVISKKTWSLCNLRKYKTNKQTNIQILFRPLGPLSKAD